MKKITLLFAAFLDRLSLGLPLVIFPPLFSDSSATGMFPGNGIHPVLLGITYASYFVGQFFSNGFFGKLSDRYGRRPILFITFAGSLVSFAITALAIDCRLFSFLLLGRLLTGVFAANYVIALSSTADVSTKKTKVKNFSFLEVAVSFGFMSAGFLGGTLSNTNLVSWFGYSTPFWLIVLLIFISIIVHFFSFEETIKRRQSRATISLFSGVKRVYHAFTAPHLRGIFSFWLLLAFGWQCCLQFYSTLLLKEYHVVPQDIGYFFVVMGILYIIAQYTVVKFLACYAEPKDALKITAFSIGLFELVVALASTKIVVAVALLCYVTAVASTIPNLASAMSNAAHDGEEGEVLGMMWAVQALAVIVASALGGYLISLNIVLPFFVGSAVALIAVAVLCRVTTQGE